MNLSMIVGAESDKFDLQRRNFISNVSLFSLLSAAYGSLSARLLASNVFSTGEVMLEDLALSPDGRTVAFQFMSNVGATHGVGLYEWQTGKITRIQNPPGKQLGAPSFSYDGNHLAVVIQDLNHRVMSDIAIVSLSTLTLKQITYGDVTQARAKTFPVFHPGGDEIIYVDGGIGVRTRLKMVKISNGSEEIVLDERNGFYLIFRPYFISPHEVYFQAIGPYNNDVKNAIINIGASTAATTVAYRFVINGRPEILFPDLEKQERHGHEDVFSSLSVSHDGASIFGIMIGNKGYQIFRIFPDERIRQISNIEGLPYGLTVSSDGSVLAFGLDPNMGKNFDLYLIEGNNKKAFKANLLDRIRMNPDFVR